MFRTMRNALGIEKSVDILDHIHSLSGDAQDDAFRKVQDIEREAMRDQKPQPGLVPLMEFLDAKSVRKAICTRNFEYVLLSRLPFSISSLPYSFDWKNELAGA